MKYQRLPVIVAAPDGGPLAVAEDLLRSVDVHRASMTQISDLYAVRGAPSCAVRWLTLSNDDLLGNNGSSCALQEAAANNARDQDLDTR